MNRFIKTAFCFILCGFLLVGCSFDTDSLDSIVDAVTPKDVNGEMNYETVVSNDGIPAKKLVFKNISFMGADAKIYIIPSDETKIEAVYPAAMKDHGFTAEILEGEIKISVPKQTNFSTEKFELTVYANIEEIEISGSISIEMNAASSEKIDLDITGGADVYIYNISAVETGVEIAGAASIDLSGKTEMLEVDLAGAGVIDAKSLISKKAEVEISGAGTAAVSVIEELLADVDGVGTLDYYGDPILKNISGGLTDIEQASKEVYGG